MEGTDQVSEHPIHGPVTISVTDDTRKLGEALEKIRFLKNRAQYYGQHRDYCVWYESDYRVCTCGFNAFYEYAGRP